MTVEAVKPVDALLGDGTILRFPAGTDPGVVDAAVKRHIAEGGTEGGARMPRSGGDVTDKDPYVLRPLTTTIKERLDTAAGAVSDAAYKTGNRLLDLLEPLDIPRDALATGVANVAHDESFLKGVQEGAARGAQTSTRELLSDEFRKEHPIMSGVAGFVGDVATDPLTWTPAAAITIPGRLGVKGLRALKNTETGQRLADNPIFRAFNVYTGDKQKAKEIYERWRNFRDSGGIAAEDEARRLDALINKMAKEGDIPPEKLRGDITEAIEQGNLHDGALGALERDLIERNKVMLLKEQQLGVDVGDLGKSYMAHVATREGTKVLQRGGGPRDRIPGTHQSQINRKIEGTVAEINATNLYGVKKFFEDDPAVIQSVREYRHANAIAGRQYLDEASTLGVNAASAPSNYVSIPGIPGKKFDPEIAGMLKLNHSRLTDEKELLAVLRLYDGAQNWWKTWALGLSPAYHSRNVMSNVWNSYLAGVTDPRTYGQAAKLQGMARGSALLDIPPMQFKGEIAGKPAREVYDAARDNGVIARGQYSADVPNVGEGRGGTGSPLNPINLSTSNYYLQKGFSAGRHLENNARFAVFIDRISKGDSYADAAKVVKKHLFDYGDLSITEQKVFKRLAPFYTWSRKNIPLQLETLVMRPDKMQKINIARQNVEQEKRPDPRNVPEWIKKAGPVYLPPGDEGGEERRAWTMRNVHPFMDLAVIVDPKGGSPLKELFNYLGPVLKTPMEFVANYDAFKERPIKKFRGQTSSLLGVQMPVKVAHLLKNFVLLGQIDRANPGNIFGGKDEEGKTTRAFGMEDPLSIDVPDWVPFAGGETFGIGAARENRMDLPGLERLMQYAFGARTYAFKPDSEELKQLKAWKWGLKTAKSTLSLANKRDMPDEVAQLMKEINRLIKEMDDKTRPGPGGLLKRSGQ